uniref:Ribokinase n=1 Tax=Steinernema glaseri TaxID=37863 RepID=A0A1I7ZY14_9BILA
MSKRDVLVFGSIVHDLVSSRLLLALLLLCPPSYFFFSYTERFPRPGESVRGSFFQSGSGGKGANQAVAAARLGSSTSIVGRVGDDVFGSQDIANLAKAGVETTHIATSKTSSTGVATITVSSDGENAIVVVLGANQELSAARADEVESFISEHKVILCQNEIDQGANLRALQIARKHGVTTFYNAAPGLADIDRSILRFTDILCVNENETEFIAKKSIATLEGFEAAALELLDEGPKIRRS